MILVPDDCLAVGGLFEICEGLLVSECLRSWLVLLEDLCGSFEVSLELVTDALTEWGWVYEAGGLYYFLDGSDDIF